VRYRLRRRRAARPARPGCVVARSCGLAPNVSDLPRSLGNGIKVAQGSRPDARADYLLPAPPAICISCSALASRLGSGTSYAQRVHDQIGARSGAGSGGAIRRRTISPDCSISTMTKLSQNQSIARQVGQRRWIVASSVIA